MGLSRAWLHFLCMASLLVHGSLSFAPCANPLQRANNKAAQPWIWPPRAQAPVLKGRPHNPCLRNTSALRGGTSTNGGVSALSKLRAFVEKRFLLVGMAVSIAIARAAPSIGRTGGPLRPELTVGTFGVGLIFFIVGLSIKTQDLGDAAVNVRLNGFIQSCSFLLMPALGYLACAALGPYLDPLFRQGLMCLMCLPTTINMSTILTRQAGGNTAAAVFNAVFGNCAGIVVTPALVLLALGESLQLPYQQILAKLSVKVILPMMVGQVLRSVSAIMSFQASYQKLFTRISECTVVAIVYSTFCDAFSSALPVAATGARGRGMPLLFLLVPTLQVCAIGLVHILSGIKALGLSPGDRVAAVYCGHQKTLAFGLPLLMTLLQGSTGLALLTLPLLLYHPTQLVLGSALATALRERHGLETY
ncbi:unnamed protein product [Chrysoparadoxa australica]